jgi:hypothetical protein
LKVLHFGQTIFKSEEGGGEIENKRRSILQPYTSTITEQQFCFSIYGKK